MLLPGVPGRKVIIMSTKRRKSPEQFVPLSQDADRTLSNGDDVAAGYRAFGVAKSSFYDWRARYGGMNVNHGKRLRELDKAEMLKIHAHGSGEWDPWNLNN